SARILFDGQPCLLSTTRDVTSRIVAEQAMRESEARFRTMFRTHDAIMLLIDPGTGAILDANDAAEAYYGYPRNTLSRMTVQDLNTATPEEIRA
ncbi:PAS domain-containing protein, partial [Clostridium perfringens]|nr:PAS domain-containing protein [Clostridium perfringens]